MICDRYATLIAKLITPNALNLALKLLVFWNVVEIWINAPTVSFAYPKNGSYKKIKIVLAIKIVQMGAKVAQIQFVPVVPIYLVKIWRIYRDVFVRIATNGANVFFIVMVTQHAKRHVAKCSEQSMIPVHARWDRNKQFFDVPLKRNFRRIVLPVVRAMLMIVNQIRCLSWFSILPIRQKIALFL